MANQAINFFYIFFFSFLPVLGWFWFILKEDPHPEPRSLTALSLLLGGVAVFLSFYAELSLEQFGLSSHTAPFLYYFYSSVIEEVFKFLPIALFIFTRRAFDEPIDAMVYMGFAALGFSFLENFFGLYTLASSSVTLVMVVALMRALSANFLHMLASVLIGFGFAESLKLRRVLPFVFSIIVAILLHFIYNMYIVEQDAMLYVFPILWAVFFIVLKEFDFIKARSLPRHTSKQLPSEHSF